MFREIFLREGEGVRVTTPLGVIHIVAGDAVTPSHQRPDLRQTDIIAVGVRSERVLIANVQDRLHPVRLIQFATEPGFTPHGFLPDGVRRERESLVRSVLDAYASESATHEGEELVQAIAARMHW